MVVKGPFSLNLGRITFKINEAEKIDFERVNLCLVVILRKVS